MGRKFEESETLMAEPETLTLETQKNHGGEKKSKKDKKKKHRAHEEPEETAVKSEKEPKKKKRKSTEVEEKEEEKKESNLEEVEVGKGVVVTGKGTKDSKYKRLDSFAESGLPDDVRDCCKKFSKPSPIQSNSWPFLLDGRDLIGIAATGSEDSNNPKEQNG